MASEAEIKIERLVTQLETGGRQIPRSVVEIPDLPYTTFQTLRKALSSGEVHLQRFAFKPNADIATILGTPSERFLTNVATLSLIAIPIVAIALGYFVSWWFLLGILLIFASLAWTKRLYNRTVFRSALGSELCFCFLFYCGQISVVTADNGKSYYWDKTQ